MHREEKFIPRNQFQRTVFALLTVVVTVHAYVFYSLYVIHGDMFMSQTGAGNVLEAINIMVGISVFGKMLLIWALVFIEFVLAITLEMLFGSPLSFKLAKVVRSLASSSGAHSMCNNQAVAAGFLSERDVLGRLRIFRLAIN